MFFNQSAPTKRIFSHRGQTLIAHHLQTVSDAKTYKQELEELPVHSSVTERTIADIKIDILIRSLSLLDQLSRNLFKNSEGKYVITTTQLDCLNALYNSSTDYPSILERLTRNSNNCIGLLKLQNISEHNRYIEYANNLAKYEQIVIPALGIASLYCGFFSFLVIVGTITPTALILSPLAAITWCSAIFTLLACCLAVIIGPRYYYKPIAESYVARNNDIDQDLITLKQHIQALTKYHSSDENVNTGETSSVLTMISMSPASSAADYGQHALST